MGSKHYNQPEVGRCVRGMLCLLWALGVLLVGAMPARAELRTLDQALVLLAPGGDIDGITKAIDLIGGHVTHVFPPAALIAQVPSDMPFQAGILALYRQTVDEATLTALPGEARRAVRVWNAWLASEASSEVLGDLDGLEAELVGDALVAPTPEELEVQYDDPTPSFYQTSEFLIGRVAVSLMLAESDGSWDPSTEDWTESEQVKVLSEIIAALDWWAANEPNAHLTFVYDDSTFAPISTSVEPINRPYSEQYLWITELMTAKGYTGSSYFDQVRQHNNALREAHKTDWAFTIFVVDSSNDSDNRFSDGYFAYAYLGGPFAVMTYGNNGYGAQNLDAIAAHEIGHIFQALDQYYSASQLCTRSSGYLGAENQNSQYGACSSNVHSIMRGGTYPSPLRRSTTINTIEGVQYRMAGNPWMEAQPSDGAFDTYSESFTFTTPPLPSGDLTVELRVIDSAGNQLTQPIDTVSVVDPVDAILDTTWTRLEQHSDGGKLTQVIYSGQGTSSTSYVAGIFFRIDEDPWQPLGADDGAFDESQEDFTITIDLTVLSPVVHEVQAYAVDGEGNMETSPATDTISVQALPEYVFLPLLVVGR